MRRIFALLPTFLMSCGGCQVDSEPIPNGFDPSARIERAAQVRLTGRGLDALAPFAEALVRDAAVLACSDDADCPVALGSSCASGACSGAFVAVDLGSVTSGAIDVCTSGACRVFASLDAVTLLQSPPSSLIATVQARFASTPIPIRDASGTECVALLDAQGPIGVELALAPASSGGIGMTVVDVALPALSPSGACGAIGADLTAAIETAARPFVRDLTALALGETCDVAADCPSGASCLLQRCREGEAILPPGLREETRVIVPPVLDAYDTPDTVADLAIQLGGAIAADADGLTSGVRGGMELVSPNPRCADVMPSPRLRSSFVAPAALPGGDTVDLDFDGVEETEYQLALALSSAFIDQAVWSVYGGGLLCGALTTSDFDDLHTGTLEIIIPSLRFLTKSHLYPRSERPARISAWLRQEPEVVLGSGEQRSSGGNTEYIDPLVHIHLRDFEINLSALIEERWVRVLTATLDLHLGVAVMITPDNEIEPIVGVGVPEIITNVRITNNELLQDDPGSIAQAIPTLLSFALLELAGSVGQFPIPTLEGTDLDVLGMRGVLGPDGTYQHAAVYADVALSTGNLSAAAETSAALIATRIPKTEDFAAGALPQIELSIESKGHGELEHQVRVDGGFWSGFTSLDSMVVSRPELAIQGRHRLEVRSRVKGDYRSLDPTPVAIEVWIDSEPPVLSVDEGVVTVWDRISDQLIVEAISAAGTETLSLDGQGRVTLQPGVARVRAIDQAGLVSEIVLAELPASTEARSGCTGVEGRGTWSGLALLLALALLIRRRTA